MAKVAVSDVRKAESDAEWTRAVGSVIDTVRTTHKLSLKEFADELQRDPRQVARWIDGKEHAQLAAVFAVARFRASCVVAFARLAALEIVTEIRVKESA
jgi:hypothetical protein